VTVYVVCVRVYVVCVTVCVNMNSVLMYRIHILFKYKGNFRFLSKAQIMRDFIFQSCSIKLRIFFCPYKVGMDNDFPFLQSRDRKMFSCHMLLRTGKNFSPYFVGPRTDFIPFILSLRKCERTDLISFVSKRNTNPIYKTLAGI